jgi:general secretion pathway protein A
MFLDFYHLRQQPFGVTPDPAYLYLSPTHGDALASLSSGVKAGRGFLALIAEPGMGKTTLLYQLLEDLRDSARTVFLFQTQCDTREFFQYLLTELGADTQGMGLVAMHGKLNEVLFTEMLAGKRFVLVVDEAQNLGETLLETVRLLSNFETPHTKLLQIILAGQPQLEEHLAQPRLSQLRQRIAVLSHLEPLSSEETAHYIEHRLSVAGYCGEPLFTPEATGLIAKSSHGVPRIINNICFEALSVAHAKGRLIVAPDIVEEAVAKLGVQAIVPPSPAVVHAPSPPRCAPCQCPIHNSIAAKQKAVGERAREG